MAPDVSSRSGDGGPGVARRRRVGLLLGTAPEMGGVYQYSLTLLDAFRELPAIDRTVLYTHASWRARLDGVAAQGIDARTARRSLALGALLTLSGLRPAWWHRVAPALDPVARRMRDAACDLWLVSAHSFVAYQMPVRAVGTVQDLMHRYERRFRHDTPWYVYGWRERVFRRLARHAAAVLVDSELGRAQFVESYGARRERVYPLPFVVPGYIRDAAAATAAPARHGLPPAFLLYPAQFWEHKNHARLVRALAAARRSCPDMHLALAGGKRLGYARLHAAVAALGLNDAVTFLGYVPDADLAGLYRCARALVYPTFYGPTNIPPLEACALGCPVAASRIYAMPEQLGDAALWFDPNSEAGIAAALVRLWTDAGLRRELAARGRERAAAWDQGAFNARLAEIVRCCLAGLSGADGSGKVPPR